MTGSQNCEQAKMQGLHGLLVLLKPGRNYLLLILGKDPMLDVSVILFAVKKEND